jgi:four helix bundle protein
MSNDQGPVEQPSSPEATKSERIYDLQERTAVFGERVVTFLRKVPETALTRRLIDQLVGAATSVGANYCEADEAVSKKEFRVKIGTCKKEANETKFFLRMLVKARPEAAEEARELWREAHELLMIFVAIYRK